MQTQHCLLKCVSGLKEVNIIPKRESLYQTSYLRTLRRGTARDSGSGENVCLFSKSFIHYTFVLPSFSFVKCAVLFCLFFMEPGKLT